MISNHSSCVLTETGWEESENLSRCLLFPWPYSLNYHREVKKKIKKGKRKKAVVLPPPLCSGSNQKAPSFNQVTCSEVLPQIFTFQLFQLFWGPMKNPSLQEILLNYMRLVRLALYRRKNELKFWGLLCCLYFSLCSCYAPNKLIKATEQVHSVLLFCKNCIRDEK